MSKRNSNIETLKLILSSVNRINAISDDEEISSNYIDEFTTKQQRNRDKEISKLLELYVDAYNYKNKSNKWYKLVLFIVCMVILLAFACALIGTIIMFERASTEQQVLESTLQLITACVTFVSLIVSILKIITKYVFPVNDEEYITRIVELIQTNDLENKKENIRVKTNGSNNNESINKHLLSDDLDI